MANFNVTSDVVDLESLVVAQAVDLQQRVITFSKLYIEIQGTFLQTDDPLQLVFEESTVNVTRMDSCIFLSPACNEANSYLLGDIVIRNNYFFKPDGVLYAASKQFISYLGPANVTFSGNRMHVS